LQLELQVEVAVLQSIYKLQLLVFYSLLEDAIYCSTHCVLLQAWRIGGVGCWPLHVRLNATVSMQNRQHI
jgi:hypothetical protein